VTSFVSESVEQTRAARVPGSDPVHGGRAARSRHEDGCLWLLEGQGR